MVEPQKNKPIILSFKVWRKLKMECAEHELTFDALVDKLIQEHLEHDPFGQYKKRLEKTLEEVTHD